MLSSFASSSLSDNWSNIQSTSERRKVQNRLAQRKYRQNVKSRHEMLKTPGELGNSILEAEFTDLDAYFQASNRYVPLAEAPEQAAALYSDISEYPNVAVGKTSETCGSETPGYSYVTLSPASSHRRFGQSTPEDEDDDSDNTPLHRAAACGHTDVVRLLLKRGANINITNQRGQTALHLAAKQGNLDVVQLLLELDDAAAADAGRTIALHIAAASGHTATVMWLLDNGADINSKLGG